MKLKKEDLVKIKLKEDLPGLPGTAGNLMVCKRKAETLKSTNLLVNEDAATWSDLDGISKTCLDLLERNASNVSPENVSDKDLLEYLGTNKRVSSVRRSIESFLSTKNEKEKE